MSKGCIVHRRRPCADQQRRRDMPAQRSATSVAAVRWFGARGARRCVCDGVGCGMGPGRRRCHVVGLAPCARADGRAMDQAALARRRRGPRHRLGAAAGHGASLPASGEVGPSTAAASGGRLWALCDTLVAFGTACCALGLVSMYTVRAVYIRINRYSRHRHRAAQVFRPCTRCLLTFIVDLINYLENDTPR